MIFEEAIYIVRGCRLGRTHTFLWERTLYVPIDTHNILIDMYGILLKKICSRRAATAASKIDQVPTLPPSNRQIVGTPESRFMVAKEVSLLLQIVVPDDTFQLSAIPIAQFTMQCGRPCVMMDNLDLKFENLGLPNLTLIFGKNKNDPSLNCLNRHILSVNILSSLVTIMSLYQSIYCI